MSRYSIESGMPRVDVCLGYDHAMCAYWMFIQDHARENNGKDYYIFHNLKDIPGGRMTLRQVKETLALFHLKLPKEMAISLINDAKQDGYLQHLSEVGKHQEAEDFLRFCSELKIHYFDIRFWAVILVVVILAVVRIYFKMIAQ